MREIGKITTNCLDQLTDFIKPGISTEDINQFVFLFQQEHELENPQFGYSFEGMPFKFPAYCCTSVNEVLCHGIPSTKIKLKEGDIISIDITFKKNGYLGDACRTYPVGKISKEAEHLIIIAENALRIGLQQCAPNNKVSDIGKYIEQYVTHNKMSVVADFVGHGIGEHFHELPSIPHTLLEDNQFQTRMYPGMTFTVEPIITLKKTKHKTLHDNWTVVSKNNTLAAQFEATVGINETGMEVFCS